MSRTRLGIFAFALGVVMVTAAIVTLRPRHHDDGWKTYRNERYGYEVRYPASWQAEIRDPRPEDDFETQNITLDNGPREAGGGHVIVWVNPQGDACTTYDTIERRAITVSGVRGEEIVCRSPHFEQRLRKFDGAKGMQTYWVLGDSKDEHSTVEQIVESFRFTD